MERIDGDSSCHGKIRYRETSARKAAREMTAKKREPFEAYPCRYCIGWHVGHPRFWKWTEEQKKTIA
jgi:hypothetical protein